MKVDMMDYLLRHSLLKYSQHGFMLTCASNLLEFPGKITEFFDNGTSGRYSVSLIMALLVDILYLDFSKAFHKVPHKRLLAKMKSLGIRGDLLKWTDSWLTGRKQRTVLNGCCSDISPSNYLPTISLFVSWILSLYIYNLH